MGIIIRQSIKASIVSYLGMAVGMVNVVVLTTRFFSPQQVGLTRVLLENALLFTALASIGAPYVATKFFAYFRNEEKKHHGFLSFLLLYGLGGFLLFAVLYFFSKFIFIYFYEQKSPELIDYYYYVLPIVFFNIFMNILETYSQVNERITVPVIVRELFLKLSNMLLIFMFALNVISFNGYLLWLIISYGVALILLLFYLKEMGWLYLSFDFSLLNRSFLKEILIYGLFIVIGGIGYILATKIDILMLPALTNLQSTGVYVIAIFIAGVIEVPRRNISQIATPILAQAIKDNNLAKVDELYKKTAINQLLAGSLLFLLIWCNIDELFQLLPKSEIYRDGKYVVFFIALSRLIDMASGLNGEIILNSKYYRFSLTSVFILAMLTISTNLIFIPVYGINGAAFATSLSVLIFTVIKLFFVWVKFDLQPYTSKILLTVPVIAVSYSITLLIPHWTDNIAGAIAGIALKSLGIIVIFFALTLKLRLSEDLNEMAKNSFLFKFFKRT